MLVFHLITLFLSKFFGDMPLGHQPLYCRFDDIDMADDDTTSDMSEKLETWAEYQDQDQLLKCNVNRMDIY